MTGEQPVLDYAKPSTAKPPSWPVAKVLGYLFLIFVLQSLFLPCLCQSGTVKMNIAMGVDAVVLVRFGVARFRHEVGRGWMAYLLLAASTLAWVPWLVGD